MVSELTLFGVNLLTPSWCHPYNGTPNGVILTPWNLERSETSTILGESFSGKLLFMLAK
jgi:hypothetical protein